MRSCYDQRRVSPEVRNLHDDYEEYLEEYEALVAMQYRDSLVLAGVVQAEDEDFTRRIWDTSLVRRVTEFLDEHGDDSAGAMSLAETLRSAELVGKHRYKLWLGPLGRHWLRKHANQLREFLGGTYGSYTRGM